MSEQDAAAVTEAARFRRLRVTHETAYVSTKCLTPGRHCDCVTGPWIQSGGIRRANPSKGEYCTCPCHHYPGATRELFDYRKLSLEDIRQYAKQFPPETLP